MLTIKRKISAQQPSVEFIANLIQRGKDTGLEAKAQEIRDALGL